MIVNLDCIDCDSTILSLDTNHAGYKVSELREIESHDNRFPFHHIEVNYEIEA